MAQSPRVLQAFVDAGYADFTDYLKLIEREDNWRES